MPTLHQDKQHHWLVDLGQPHLIVDENSWGVAIGFEQHAAKLGDVVHENLNKSSMRCNVNGLDDELSPHA